MTQVIGQLRTREELCYYEGGSNSLPSLLAGKLTLTQKFLAMHVYDVRKIGIFERGHLAPTGKTISIPLTSVVDVSTETLVRAKRSRPNWKSPGDFRKKAESLRPFNVPPQFLEASERVQQLVVLYEAENGLETAIFEVANAQAWANQIRDSVKGLRP